jgi:hypothetical protein
LTFEDRLVESRADGWHFLPTVSSDFSIDGKLYGGSERRARVLPWEWCEVESRILGLAIGGEGGQLVAIRVAVSGLSLATFSVNLRCGVAVASLGICLAVRQLGSKE